MSLNVSMPNTSSRVATRSQFRAFVIGDSIFLSEKRLHGSLELALKANSDADKNHVSDDERAKIADALRSHYIENHPGYKEPTIQQEINF